MLCAQIGRAVLKYFNYKIKYKTIKSQDSEFHVADPQNRVFFLGWILSFSWKKNIYIKLPLHLLLERGVGEGTTPFPRLLHFTLDTYLETLSVK